MLEKNTPRKELSGLTSLITKGTTPTTMNRSFSAVGEIPFLKAENIENGRLIVDAETLHIDDETDSLLKRSRIQPLDVLLSMAGTIGKVAVVPENAGRMNCNQALAIIRTKSELDPRYLYFWLLSQDAKDQMNEGKVTATISNLSLGQIGGLRLPFPSSKVQKQITAVLAQAHRLTVLLRRAYELAQVLPMSAFNHFFGEELTGRWNLEPFEDMCTIESTTVMPTTAPYQSYIHIGGANIESVTGRLVDLKTAEEEGLTSIKFLVKPSNILFSKIRPKLRKVCYPRFQAICSADIYPLEPNTAKCTTEYMLYFLRSEFFSKLVTDRAESRSNIPKVNRDELKEIYVPCPALELQHEFSRIVQACDPLIKKREYAYRKALESFEGLLDSVFTTDRIELERDMVPV